MINKKVAFVVSFLFLAASSQSYACGLGHALSEHACQQQCGSINESDITHMVLYNLCVYGASNPFS